MIACPAALIENPARLRCACVIVEIDESEWGYKKKYNVGRMVKEGTWTFGITERGIVKTAVFLLCSTRSAEELIPKTRSILIKR